MRFATAALAIAIVFTLCPSAHAKGKNSATDTGTAGDKSINATVVSVSGTSLTVSVTNKKGKSRERHVKTNEKTKITLDGKEAKLSELKKDEQVSITLAHGLASEISAASLATTRTSGAGTADNSNSTPK